MSLFVPGQRGEAQKGLGPIRDLNELKWPQLDVDSMGELLGLYGTQALKLLDKEVVLSHPGKQDLRSAMDNPHFKGDIQEQSRKLSAERANGGRTAGPSSEARRILKLPTVSDALTRVDFEQFFEQLGMEARNALLTRGRDPWVPHPTAEWVLVPPSLQTLPGMESAWSFQMAPNIRSIAWTNGSQDVLTLTERRGIQRTQSNRGSFWVFRDRDSKRREVIQASLRRLCC